MTAPRTDQVVLSGADLTPAVVALIADGGGLVDLDRAALVRVETSFRVAGEVARRRAVYGRSTGVGANLDSAVAHAGLSVLRSHAGGAGELVEPRAVRAMMAVRANQLLVGASGAHPRLVQALADALNRDAHPAIHEYGSIGTGDLTALAELALTMLGERPWAAGELAPVAFEDGDALAFLSSGAMTIGQAALGAAEFTALADSALVVAALSVQAQATSGEPFAAQVHAARAHPGSVEAARRLRELIEPATTNKVQDPYGTRALPQVHGTLLDELDRLHHVLAVELNTGAENPFVSIEAGEIFHHGGWHQAPLSAAATGLNVALLGSAQLAAGRIASLMDGQPPFLAARPGASGLLVLEYTAASAIGELRTLATPAALGHAVVSLGVENQASFAAQAVRQLSAAVKPYRIVLACELVAAVRALRLTVSTMSGPLGRAFDVCDPLPSSVEDRALDADLELAMLLLDQLGSV
jgi:histidine ammonia-lyase